MDHPYLALNGLTPRPVYPFRGPDITSGLETLRDGKFREKHASFRASISNWGWVGEPAGSVAVLLNRAQFGKSFRRQLKDKLSRMIRLGVFLEQLPNPNNRVTIDPSRTDILGNYLPILNYSYDDYSMDGALAALDTFWPIVLEKTGISDETDFTTVPGGFQAVTHRGQTFNIMGPAISSAPIGWDATFMPPWSIPTCAVWAHDNLYMLGAGSMVTIGTSNPTLTAVALSLRAAKQMLQGLS